MIIAGVDEAGRGPLAGPVVAAAVILDNNKPIAGIDDSKRLSAAKRSELSKQIKQHARAYGIAFASVEEIDRLNILQASLLAMQRAVESLSLDPQRVLIDGNFCPVLACEAEAIIKGDQKILSIGAASILAKVTRDEFMIRLDAEHPRYGFAQHKGYPTRTHLEALQRYGPSPVHRHSFAPVRRALAAQ